MPRWDQREELTHSPLYCDIPRERAGRGVYHLPWVGPREERFLAIVDRNGTALFHATVYRPEHTRAAELALWELLDQMDPVPPLHVVP